MMTPGAWTRPDCDTNACMEAALLTATWTKPECDTSACVEVAELGAVTGVPPGPVEITRVGDKILMRNGADPDNVVEFTLAEWAAFERSATSGRFAV